MELNHEQLKKILPQAYPFLLIDRVTEVKEGESLVAVKNITANEWFFQQEEIETFPETLLVEAAAQAAIVLYHVSKVKEGEKEPLYFLGRTKAEFHDTVSIGDQINLSVKAGKLLKSGGYTDVEITANNKKKANIEIIYGLKQD